ncbi:MAG TPA: Ig-like domain-containing protein [Longimicrobium sp.]|nr:Ig-like domain-containing protein [Longimicrobium sp.]
MYASNDIIRRRRPGMGLARALTLLAALTACDSATGANPGNGPRPGPTDPGTPAAVARVELVAPASSLAAGATMQLTATPRDRTGAALAGRPVAWTSSDEGVATVSAAGLVAARAAGTVVVTAASEGRSAQVTLTVQAVPVARVELEPGGSVEVQPGATLQLTAVARAADGTPLTGRAAAWASSDEAVARVSATGTVQAVATGAAAITVTVEGKSAQVIAFVPSPVAWVDLSPRGAAMAVGEALQLTAQPRGADDAAVDRPVTWSSGNPAVAAVDRSGRVTGRAAGNVVITATSDGKSASAHLIVATWTERELLAVGDSALPATLYTTIQNGTPLRVQATSGSLRMLAGSRFELRVGAWLYFENAPAVQAILGTSGSYYYDLAEGGYVFGAGPASPGFRGRMLPDGRMQVTWRPQPNAPEVTLVFAAE